MTEPAGFDPVIHAPHSNPTDAANVIDCVTLVRVTTGIRCLAPAGRPGPDPG
jgi:hypothetical protein